MNKDITNLYKRQARDIVSQMTLIEKIMQMLHSAPEISRLNIKAYNWWNESLHGVARAGVATVFPQAISLAATFNQDLIEEVAEAISTEGRAKFNVQQEFDDRDIYKGLTFWAPNVNIFRDPRWGRGHETYGEDPYLTSRLGVRFIKGLQGSNKDYIKTAACAKHFAVHSGPEDIRHSFDAIVNKQDLYETYLPAFKACVQEAHVEAVMGAYNRVNGEPCCGSKVLLVDILREEWGFDGHIVSDCWAIKDFHENHRVTKNSVESVTLAVKNGCDVNCGNQFQFLIDAVKQGLVTEDEIDLAVIRLFTTRLKLGLFEKDKIVPFNNIGFDKVDSREMRALNLKASKESIILLKNENNILPLNSNKLKSVGVIGPNANNRNALVGNYEGTASRYITVLEGVQDYLGDDVKVNFSDGCHLFKDQFSSLGEKNDRISEVKAVCKHSDVIIACFGLDPSLEGEEGDTGNQYASGDKPNLDLPGIQEQVLKTIYECGKPVILVLLSGSALAINWADENIPAIIHGSYPGAVGGQAIAEAIFGKYSPNGKLPITFYKTTDELPDFTDYSMKNRTYRYMKQDALYPFGFGLTYSEFCITEVEINRTDLSSKGVDISMIIENIGDVSAGEIVQVYVKVELEDSPNPQLKSFRKVFLGPKEQRNLKIHLPLEAFVLHDTQGRTVVNRADYTIWVGTSQPDSRSEYLTGIKPVELKLKSAEEIEIS